MFRLICIMLMLLGNLLLAQSQGSNNIQSLIEMDYDQLYRKIHIEKDSLEKRLYLKAYLYKARGDNNFEKIVSGYKNYLHHSAVQLRLVYADSMVMTAKKSHDECLLASAYLTKGIAYYGKKDHQKALNSYLIADTLATRAKAPVYLIYKIKYAISHVKLYLGNYEQALELLVGCMNFYKDSHIRPYLNILHSISLCYRGLGDYHKSNHFNALGLEMGKRLDMEVMEPYFIHSQGINAYYLKSYSQSKEIINGILPKIAENKDFANVILGKFYIGMNLWELNRQQEAISYFKEVDKSFMLKGYTKPEYQKAYKLLVEYYGDQNNQQQKSYYTDRLLVVDSVIHSRYKSLSNTVHTKYNMAKLKSEKMALYAKWLELKKRGFIWKVIAALLLGVLLWWRMWSLGVFSKLYSSFIGEKKQNVILNGQDTKEEVGLYIPQETKESIYTRLKEFEDNKDYLQEIGLEKMASQFNTNSKYLSKVIQETKNKTFSAYMNELKIEELLRILEDDKKSRKFSYKALVKMVGLGSETRLNRAFKLRTNTTVASYIKQLEAKENKQERNQ